MGETWMVGASEPGTVLFLSDALVDLADVETGTTTYELHHGPLAVSLLQPFRANGERYAECEEVYVVVQGRGTLVHGTRRTPVWSGDFLLVPARTPHRFEGCTSDLTLWAVKYETGARVT